MSYFNRKHIINYTKRKKSMKLYNRQNEKCNLAKSKVPL